METAKEARTVAAHELSEAIRQALRYLQGHNPSIRLIEQRFSRAKISVDDEEESKYLSEKTDRALDCVDECMIFIEDRQAEKIIEDEDKVETAILTKQVVEKKACLDKSKAEATIDEKVADDLLNKINSIVDKLETTTSDVALAKIYGEKLWEIIESLNTSWKLHITESESEQAREELTTEIGHKRVLYENAHSRALSLVESRTMTSTQNLSSVNNSNSGDIGSDSRVGLLVKPEKMKLPLFSGNIRNFARFKKNFKEIVLPFYPEETQQLYVIKQNCLQSSAKSLVENVESMSDLWKRLDDRFGDKIDLVDVVIKDLKSLPNMKGNDDMKLVQMVDTLEKGLLDLEAVDARQEIANAYTVAIVESKISRQLFMAWIKVDERDDDENTHRFEKMLTFLKDERRRRTKLLKRVSISDTPPPPPPARSFGSQGTGAGNRGQKCLVHQNATHFTRKCNVFKGKSSEERAAIVKEIRGCILCLSTDHIGQPCPWKERWGPCRQPNCGKFHSHLLHDADNRGLLMCLRGANPLSVPPSSEPSSLATPASSTVMSSESIQFGNNVLLLVQSIPSDSGPVIAFFDNGSTISLVSKSFTNRHNLKGVKVSYELTTVGGKRSKQETVCYHITIRDSDGAPHVIEAFEIDDICGKMRTADVSAVTPLFSNLSAKDVSRESANIEMLIGMRNAAIHPTRIQEVDGLVLYASKFGTNRVLGGTHPLLMESDYVEQSAAAIAHAKVRDCRVMSDKHLDGGVDFITSEDFGVKLFPRCDRCINCKHCTYEIHQMSKAEQRELHVIEDNLTLDPVKKQWTTSYPYKCDPSVLQNNEGQVTSLLEGTEKRIRRNPKTCEAYKEQFECMVARGDFRELEPEEIGSYKGPVFYVSHHEVYKEGSTSTPIRIVINSSLKFRGKSLNDILMKGPNPLNNLFGVQLRFRSYKYVLVTDISKMYTMIKTTEKERHLRRVKWRDADLSRQMRVYGTETMMFGDRPAGTIATVALRKTAKIYKHINEDASKKIIRDSYMDDIVTGADHLGSREKLKCGIVDILGKGGFKPKGFIMSGGDSAEPLNLLGSGEVGRVLGMGWNPRDDVFQVSVRINLSIKTRKGRTEPDLSQEEIPSIINMKLTKRILLSFINNVYEPLGLASPITVQLKILMRTLYATGVGWDDEIGVEMKKEWIKMISRVKETERVRFKRCVKPDAADGNPVLIICSDGSDDAMCATVYIRWQCKDTFKCTLWTAKTRVTPIKKLSMPRIEMQGAVMGVRLSEAVRRNAIWTIDTVYHIVDSLCTLATLMKETTALREFMGNRVTECLDTTKIENWYHVKSEDNIADLGTRSNATAADIAEGSDWQNGRWWMSLPVSEWPVTQEIGKTQVPDEDILRTKFCGVTQTVESPICFNKYLGRSYQFVINLVARMLKIAELKSLKNNKITAQDTRNAETFMLKKCMDNTEKLLKAGKLKSLKPGRNSEGVIILQSRAVEGLKKHYGTEEFPILATDDPVSQLWIKKIHEEDHGGLTKVVAKSRRKYWIVRARKVAAKVIRSCYKCRLYDKVLAEQIMAPLPTSRLITSPTFHEISLDLFGPFEIRDTVKGRARKKVWGLILNCVATRALHLDLTEDYGADAFLQAFRRFVALRRAPAVVYCDKGSQLLAGLEDYGASRGMKVKATPAEAQHQNGLSESLIKSVKKTLTHVIGNNVLTFSGLQTVFFEVATIVNSRPIGIISGSDPSCPEHITPNHLILDSETTDAVVGDFNTERNVNKRYRFIQSLVDSWWKKWYNSVLPSLVPCHKWLQRHRNVRIGDICLIRYKNEIRATYRLGRVTEVYPSSDGIVRKVLLQYKLPNEKAFRYVDRAIHGIAVIVPVEEQSEKSNVEKCILNPDAPTFQPTC